jgi:hypothetical protein
MHQVFVRAVHEAKWMNEMEISIYDSWFDPVVSSLPGLIPDGFIYLRASPDTCHKRMMLRKRSEEGGVSLDYLQGLHEKHESWLFPSKGGGRGVLSVSQLPMHMEGSLPPGIRDRVFYLEGDHMHSSIQKVHPILICFSATKAPHLYLRNVQLCVLNIKLHRRGFPYGKGVKKIIFANCCYAGSCSGLGL